jgi:hypothetical protein
MGDTARRCGTEGPIHSTITSEEVAAMTTTLERAPLSIADRCDRCGAQAFVRAIFVSGDLMFCGHHGRELRPLLDKDALLVEDGTDLINTRPSPSANAEDD